MIARRDDAHLDPSGFKGVDQLDCRVVDLGALRLQPPEEDAVFLVPEPMDGFLLWAIRGIPIWEFDPA